MVKKFQPCIFTGEAMEQGLRDCCRSIRIGKILIHTDEETHDAKVVYAKLPPDIANRKVLLMYPIMSKFFQPFKAPCPLKMSIFFLIKVHIFNEHHAFN